MDHRFLKHVMGIPIRSTRGLLLSKPYQSHYPISASSKINGTEREYSFAVWIKNHVSIGPKLIENMKHKLGRGAKILLHGQEGKIFRRNFSIREGEKLLQASRCYLYTTAGAIAGLLFLSTERVGFCSDKSVKAYSTTGEHLKFQYKVSIPLGKIKGVQESMNMKKPSNKYVELVTVDEFNFWFVGLQNYKKTLRYLCETIHPESLSN